jgi:hypothetical protein
VEISASLDLYPHEQRLVRHDAFREVDGTGDLGRARESMDRQTRQERVEQACDGVMTSAATMARPDAARGQRASGKITTSMAMNA